MPDPIQALVLRAWNDLVITCYWDRPTVDNQPGYFVIRQVRLNESGPVEKTIRLTPSEASTLARKIMENPVSSSNLKNEGR